MVFLCGACGRLSATHVDAEGACRTCGASVTPVREVVDADATMDRLVLGRTPSARKPATDPHLTAEEAEERAHEKLRALHAWRADSARGYDRTL